MGRRIGALGVLLAVALGGCGGGSDKSSSSNTGTTARNPRRRPRRRKRSKAKGATPRGIAPEPVESLSDALTAFRQATASGKCEDLLPLENSAERGGVPPESAPTPEECANNAALIAQLKDQTPVANERFGPTAVVDYTRNCQDVTGLWLVQADGRWRFLVNGQFLTHSVGTRPAQSNAFDEGVNGFASASQSKNCNEMYRFLNPDSPFLFGRTQDQWCSYVTPSFDQQNNFFHDAAANPSVKPHPLGKNRLYGLYDIDFGNIADGFQMVYSGSFAPS